ncbi:hypothetical protein TNCV_35091 [Trichonephila clavipes]|nr:hypothetical protein TNCV_35091 [Trichonephila clavipes]
MEPKQSFWLRGKKTADIHTAPHGWSSQIPLLSSEAKANFRYQQGAHGWSSENITQSVTRTQLFIDKPRQCNNCYSFTPSSRFCSSDVRCINCGGSHSGQVLIVEDPILDNVQTLQIAQTVKETIQQTPPLL